MQAIALFKRAYDNGIRFFDTGYSYEAAEKRIGLALKGHLSWIRESLNASLSRMGIDYMDILYIHRGTIQDLEREDVRECFLSLKRSGLIRAFGVNTFDSETIDYNIEHNSCDVVMLDYNIVMKEREPQMERLFHKGIGVVAGQAVAEGLFHKELFRVRSRKDLWYLLRALWRRRSRGLFFKARKYGFLNKGTGDGAVVALKYVVDNPYVSSASFGTCSIEHLYRDCSCLDYDIQPELLERIRNTEWCWAGLYRLAMRDDSLHQTFL